MDNETVTTIDLIRSTTENNPTAVGQVFNDLVMAKIADAVAAKKQELAQTMFDYDSDESDDDDTDLDDQDQDTDDEVDEDEDTETDA